MGLDIFFNKRNKNNEEDSQELGYFRKVNFLVKFMEEYGFDTPDQTPLTLNEDIIEDLHNRCEKVLELYEKHQNTSLDFENECKAILPTCDGFFFGGTSYDKWYVNDVKEVKTFCENLLKEFEKLHDDEEIFFVTWY